MTRGSVGALVALALAAGLALRLARLDVRPMHHDEANQAVKFGALLETGDYRYDAHDHHGPTLYYLSLPAAWMRGEHTLASLDETTLRGVTAAFGAATILLLPLVSHGIGRTAVAASAFLVALSPAMVFYSRMYIQESLFACFTLASVIGIGRLAWAGEGHDRIPSPVPAGLAAGLAIATKETSAIVLPAAVLACALAWWSMSHRRVRGGLPPARWARTAALTAGVAAAIAAVFYSSFFAHPDAILGPLRGAGTYVERGTSAASHGHPWHYYASLLVWSGSGGLAWSEALVLALAALGAASAWLRPDPVRAERTFWGRYLAGYAAIAAVIFSALPYKTPWNLLPFYVAVLVVAGIGFSALVHASASRALRVAVIVAVALASAQLGRQAWRASVTYASDPRNPYVYAQTVPDAVRMAARIRELAALHQDGSRMQVSVVAPPHEQWPLPWYLRTMPNVGYWMEPGDPQALAAPVVVSSIDHTAALDAALGDRYASEYFGLRPEVLLALYVERGLYDRFLARVAAGDAGLKPCPPPASASPVRQGFNPARATRDSAAGARCGPGVAVALWRATSAE